MKLIAIIATASLVLLSCQTTPAVKNEQLATVDKGSFHYSGEKIAIGEIEGYPEAVGLLKSSIINALMGKYISTPDKASYTITGTIYAKRYWRMGRPYIYHTIELRLIDKKGDIVMVIQNTKPVWQAQLRDFSAQLSMAIE
jgi:hypothetical protein